MSKAKGRRYEHRTIKLLEAVGYKCTLAAGSLGEFDVIALGPHNVRAIQVKGGDKPYLPPLEREAIKMVQVCDQVSKEFWKFYKHKREPIIEIL
jgi:hypothetical protein